MFDDVATVLPPHSTDLERALEQASLWVIRNSEVVDIWNAETAPERFLPWLAWSVSVDYWDSNWPVEIKRKVILESHVIHRLKGTRGAVRRALGAMGFDTDIVEWFEAGGTGQPYTFRIDAYADDVFSAGYNIDAALLARLTRIIGHVKPVRAHFHLRIGETFTQDMHGRSGVADRLIDRREAEPEGRPAEAEASHYGRSGIEQARTSRQEHDPDGRPIEAAAAGYTRTLAGSRIVSKQTHVFEGRPEA